MSRTPAGVDSHLRSVVKGVSYRVVGSLATVLVSFAMTGSVRVATLIGSGEILAKIALFWGHERLWHRVAWGRASATEAKRERPSQRPPAPRTSTHEADYRLSTSSSAHRA